MIFFGIFNSLFHLIAIFVAVVKLRMKKLLYTTFVFALLTVCSTSLNAEVATDVFVSVWAEESDDDSGEKTTIEVLINGSTTARLENVPLEGTLDVYSILGVKVTSLKLKNHLSNYMIDLPNGIYILKAGKVSKKVVVR